MIGLSWETILDEANFSDEAVGLFQRTGEFVLR